MVEIIEEDIEKFDIIQAKKLLINIRSVSDLRLLKVQDPQGIELKWISMQEWVKWYYRRTQNYGDTGIESQVMNIISNIDQHLTTTTSKVEEGFRKLLNVLEKREKRIKYLKDIIEKKEEVIDELYNKLAERDLKLIKSIYNEATKIEEKESGNNNEKIESKTESPLDIGLFRKKKESPQ